LWSLREAWERRHSTFALDTPLSAGADGMWARAQQRALQQSQRTQFAEGGGGSSVDDNVQLEQQLRTNLAFASSATSEPTTPHNTPVPDDVFSTPPRTTPTKSISKPSTPLGQQQPQNFFSSPLLPNSTSVRPSKLSGSLEKSLFGASGGEITEAEEETAAWSSSSVFGSSTRSVSGDGGSQTMHTPGSGGDMAAAAAAAAFELDCQTPTAPVMPWLQRSLAERTVSTEVQQGGPVEDCALAQSVDGSCLSNAPEVRTQGVCDVRASVKRRCNIS
jgi:hypothetical protein